VIVIRKYLDIKNIQIKEAAVVWKYGRIWSDPKRSGAIQSGREQSKAVGSDPKRSGAIQSGRERSKAVGSGYGPKRSGAIQSGRERSKTVGSDPKRSGAIFEEFLDYSKNYNLKSKKFLQIIKETKNTRKNFTVKK
jgi:hypothetical protein